MNNEKDLEAVLERHLGRTAAPRELWRRIQSAQNSPASVPVRRVSWIFAAALSLAALVWGFHARRANDPINATIERALAQTPQNLEFRSNNAAEIRAWVKESAGVDIPLPAESSSKVRMVGARIVRGKGQMAEVAYQVNGRYAILLVSRDAPGPQKSVRHGAPAIERANNVQVSTWAMGGQSYILGYAGLGDFRIACLACHSN